MGISLFVAIAIGINLIRDDLIVKSTIVETNIGNSTMENVESNSTFRFGCSIETSIVAQGVITAIMVVYAVLLVVAMSLLTVTWSHIWIFQTLPPQGFTVETTVLRRKPEFVNSKFVDGYLILVTSLTAWTICSVIALVVEFSPLPHNFREWQMCNLRRFGSTFALFIATLIKFFLYISFSFTFRRAFLEIFIGPCCSSFYRRQHYVVSRSSPFDKKMRVAAITYSKPSTECNPIQPMNLFTASPALSKTSDQPLASDIDNASSNTFKSNPGACFDLVDEFKVKPLKTLSPTMFEGQFGSVSLNFINKTKTGMASSPSPPPPPPPTRPSQTGKANISIIVDDFSQRQSSGDDDENRV